MFFSACPAFFVKVGFFPFQFVAFFLAVVAVEKLFPVILLLRTALFGISAFGTAKLSFLCCLGRSGLGGFLLSRSRFSRTAVFASSVIAFSTVFTCYFHYYSASVQVDLIECADNIISLLLRHFKEREVLDQVYSSDSGALLLHVAVNQLNNLVGIVAVCLA